MTELEQELLEACQPLREMSLFVPDEKLKDDDIVCISVGTFRKIRAVIKKAEGKQP